MRGKLLGLAVAGVTLAGLLSFALQRQIGEAIFARAVAQSVGRDTLAELPDGLHIYMCGTGSPMPDMDRAGPCIAVLAGTRAFLFDVGAGSVRKLGRTGFPIFKLERLFLTHLHSDHFDGMGELLVQAWVTGSRTSPLPVSGPIGVADVVAGFNAAYRIDSGFRTAHHGQAVAPSGGYGGVGEAIALSEKASGQIIVLQDRDLKITAFTVSHAPVEPAFGYRVDYNGRSIVISGDTLYSANLVAVAQGADMLLHEALNPKMVAQLDVALTKKGQTAAAKVAKDIPSYHATPEDAARAAHAAGVKQLVMYHTIPPLPSRLLYGAFLGDAADIFRGPVVVAEDGMRFSLPANSREIHKKQVLR
jgi:ribonuclease Z